MIEIPYVLLQTVIYCLIVYRMIDFEWTAVKFFWFLFFMFFSFLYFTFYGMMAIALTPNSDIAAVVAAAFYGIWNIFAGFVTPLAVSFYLNQLSHIFFFLLTNKNTMVIKTLCFVSGLLQRIPIWWKWYYWACPVGWSLYGLFVSQFSDRGDVMETGETVKAFLRRYFGFRHDFLGVAAGSVIGFNVIFIFIFAYSIKSINFQKR